jgi:hypothetical protein
VTRLRSSALALCLCLPLALGGCGGGDDDNSSTQADTIGSGATCTERLREVVTVDYLRKSGLGISNPQVAEQELSRAIAEVCQRGPATMSITEGARKVVLVINQRFVG